MGFLDCGIVDNYTADVAYIAPSHETSGEHMFVLAKVDLAARFNHSSGGRSMW